MHVSKVVLAAVLLSAGLVACKKSEPAPAPVETATPPAAETAPTPMPADPAVPAEPGAAEPGTMPPTSTPPVDAADEDMPHSGGDKVGTAPSPPPAN